MAVARTAALRLLALLAISSVSLAGCADLRIAPQQGIVTLAAPSDPVPLTSAPSGSASGGDEGSLGDPVLDTPLCWAVAQDLPIMDDAGLDPQRAEYFVAWGRYLRDVDDYLRARMPMLERMVEQAPADERPGLERAMAGALRMQAAVHAAAGRLMRAHDPVPDAVVRIFTVASTDFLDGLYQLCPSWRAFEMASSAS